MSFSAYTTCWSREQKELLNVSWFLSIALQKCRFHLLIMIPISKLGLRDDDYQANQSELKFLRIQLQAIQVQCTNCIHRHDDDPELTDSIMNWKIDWENINKRAKARRLQKNHAPLNHQLSDTSTFVESLNGT